MPETNHLMDYQEWKQAIETTTNPDEYLRLISMLAQNIRDDAQRVAQMGTNDAHNTMREFAQHMDGLVLYSNEFKDMMRNGFNFTLITNTLDNHSSPHPKESETTSSLAANYAVSLINRYRVPKIVNATIVRGEPNLQASLRQSALRVQTVFHGFHQPQVTK